MVKVKFESSVPIYKIFTHKVKSNTFILNKELKKIAFNYFNIKAIYLERKSLFFLYLIF